MHWAIAMTKCMKVLYLVGLKAEVQRQRQSPVVNWGVHAEVLGLVARIQLITFQKSLGAPGFQNYHLISDINFLIGM